MPWKKDYFPHVRRAYKLPIVLSQEEVGALIAACKGDCYLAVRNRALIALLYRIMVHFKKILLGNVALGLKQIAHRLRNFMT